MSNPFLDRASKGMDHGRKSEKRVAKQMGARLHPNSGAMRGAKSDASLKESDFQLEMKSTVTMEMKLHIGWLAKISMEALSQGKRPGLVFSFVDAEGKARMHQSPEWVAIPLEVFKELLGNE